MAVFAGVDAGDRVAVFARSRRSRIALFSSSWVILTISTGQLAGLRIAGTGRTAQRIAGLTQLIIDLTVTTGLGTIIEAGYPTRIYRITLLRVSWGVLDLAIATKSAVLETVGCKGVRRRSGVVAKFPAIVDSIATERITIHIPFKTCKSVPSYLS